MQLRSLGMGQDDPDLNHTPTFSLTLTLCPSSWVRVEGRLCAELSLVGKRRGY